MAEAARMQLVELVLADVAERRVAQIVAKGNRLCQVLVQVERPRDGARDLRDLEGMRQPSDVVVAGRRNEHLCLVLQASERLGVDDAVAVPLELGPKMGGLLRRLAATTLPGPGGISRKGFLPLLQTMADVGHDQGMTTCRGLERGWLLAWARVTSERRGGNAFGLGIQ